MGSIINEKILKEKYFLVVRIVIMLLFSMYGMLGINEETGVSEWILLLISLFISMICLKEFVDGKKRILFLIAAAVIVVALIYMGGLSFIFLGAFLYYEFLLCFRADKIWYYMIYLIEIIDRFFLVKILGDEPMDGLTQLIILSFMLAFYMQHEFVVTDYEKRMMEDTITQQGLKKDMKNQESAAKAAMEKNLLMSENKILEERAALSQTLHDKLGHNINGSIYQLEASKVVMEKDPEKARSMIQAVIDQLRTGMDEIRAILRKERPEKKQMALLQLHQLCADCNDKGVEAELSVEGDTSAIDGKIWEVLLDNCFEAVTNSMRYSKCKSINITIIAMNKMVRCTVADDGIGCDKLEDGMGLSGMRQRVRMMGGTIDFETHPGFKVSMLIPLE